MEGWGECIIEQLADYTVIDLETTGLSSEWDAIIEVAAVRVRGHEVAQRYTQLVNPQRPIDSFITELTGITNEMVAGAPAIQAVAPEFLAFIGQDVIVGHNVRFDLGFLRAAAQCAGHEMGGNDFIDTMRISRRLYPDQRHHRLCDMAQQFGLSETVGHRALADTDLTQQLYERLCAELEARPDRDALKKRRLPYKLAEGLQPEESSEIDPSAIYYGKQFAFTGVLDRMGRKEAMQIVVNHGGTCADSVTKETNFLVLGNNDYVKSIKDGKSQKQKKAEGMILKGKDIQIISEDVFYEMFGIR